MNERVSHYDYCLFPAPVQFGYAVLRLGPTSGGMILTLENNPNVKGLDNDGFYIAPYIKNDLPIVSSDLGIPEDKFSTLGKWYKANSPKIKAAVQKANQALDRANTIAEANTFAFPKGLANAKALTNVHAHTAVISLFTALKSHLEKNKVWRDTTKPDWVKLLLNPRSWYKGQFKYEPRHDLDQNISHAWIWDKWLTTEDEKIREIFKENFA